MAGSHKHKENIVNFYKRGFRIFALVSVLAASLVSQNGIQAQTEGPLENRFERQPGLGRGNLGGLAPISQPTDQIIIKFKPTAENAPNRATDARIAAVERAAGNGLIFLREMSGDASVFKLPTRISQAEAGAMADKIMSNAADLEIEYAEPDAILQADGAPREAEAPQSTPNDSYYNLMWHLKAANYGANLPGAWDITTGAAGVRVAVIDTGIRPEHPDLAGRIEGGYDFIADLATANDGNGRDSDPSDPGDWVDAGQCGSAYFHASSWHGTHVAGTIGAIGNNNAGITGINWVSKIVPVRVLGKCGGYTSDIVDGMRWAAGLSVSGVPANGSPARVLNMSLGGSGSCPATTQSAINDINGVNAIVVVAAGNDKEDASAHNPANCAGVITVAATNRIGDMALYSNRGSRVDISAPGGDQYYGEYEGVLSTVNLGETTPGASGYAFYQGTSMATPHVAGIVSLMLSVNGSLNRAQVLSLIRASATSFPSTSSCSTAVCGAGIINAGSAVSMARANTTRRIFLPLLGKAGTPQSLGIYGTVKQNGTAISGVGVELRRNNWDSGTYTVIASATTDGNGQFKFLGAPTLSQHQSYYVRYFNNSNSARLFLWETKKLPYYAAGSSINIGNFDIADITTTAPAPNATVSLPQAFTWNKRAASPTDSYFVRYFNPSGDEFFVTEPYLGYVNSYTLPSGLLSQYGFQSGTQYGWDVGVFAADFGFGFPFYYNPVKFNNP